MHEYRENSAACSAAEDLLIRESLDGLQGGDAVRLRQHLRTCAPCRSYQELLHQFRKSLDVEPRPALRPDPAMHRRLRSMLQPRRRSGSLAQLLNLRVPVYQAVLGAAAAVFIVFAATRLSPDTRHQPIPLAAPSSAEYARVDSYEVLEKLKRLDVQTRGWGHAEDSLLIRFHSTSLEPADSI